MIAPVILFLLILINANVSFSYDSLQKLITSTPEQGYNSSILIENNNTIDEKVSFTIYNTNDVNITMASNVVIPAQQNLTIPFSVNFSKEGDYLRSIGIVYRLESSSSYSFISLELNFSSPCTTNHVCENKSSISYYQGPNIYPPKSDIINTNTTMTNTTSINTTTVENTTTTTTTTITNTTNQSIQTPVINNSNITNLTPIQNTSINNTQNTTTSSGWNWKTTFIIVFIIVVLVVAVVVFFLFKNRAN